MELQDKFNLKIIIGIVILVVVIVVGVVWLVLDLNKKDLPDQGDLATEDQTEKPRPVRYGEMRLETEDEFKVGEKIQVKVVIDTQGSNIVVGVAAVDYDATALELITVDEESSVLEMTIIKEQEEGKIEVVRGVPGDADYLDSDDGFTGVGELVSLEFKVLKVGDNLIELNQDNSSLILDDARGTKMVLEYGDL